MATVYKRQLDRNRKGTKWIVRWFDAEAGKWKDKTAYADKEASLELGRTLERESSRRAEGIIDPFEQHLKTPISTFIGEWADGLRCARGPQMRMHVERIVNGTGCDRLHRLDAPAVQAFLAKLKSDEKWSDTTYNEYVASIRSFTRWAVTNRRLSSDPLVGLARIGAKHVKAKRPRRALTLEEVGRLMKAAEQRSMNELLLIRRGKRKGLLVANVRERAKEKARQRGQERRLSYLLAFWLRLRRSEIRQLRWGDIDLESIPPKVMLRAETTKAKRADSLPLHPQLANALRAYRPTDADDLSPIVGTVPNMKAVRADLKAAGIPDVDAKGRRVDLHALGKSFITAMASHGVSQRSAQSLARHTDPRLTAKTYTDESLLPLADELSKVPAIPDPDEVAAAAIPLRVTGTDDVAPQQDSDSASIQQTGGAGRHPVSLTVIPADGKVVGNCARAVVLNRQENQGFGINRHGLSPTGDRPFKRAGEGGRTLDIHVGNMPWSPRF